MTVSPTARHYTIRPPPPALVDRGMAGVDAIAVDKLLADGLGLRPPRCVIYRLSSNKMALITSDHDAVRLSIRIKWL